MRNDPFLAAIEKLNREFEERCRNYPAILQTVKSLQVFSLTKALNTRPTLQATFVGQGEYGIVEKGKTIGTFRLETCLGILVVGKQGAALAHVDTISDPKYFLNMSIKKTEAERCF